MLTKTCTACSTDQPTESFFKHKNGLHGVGSWCKGCTRTYYSSPERKQARVVFQSRLRTEKRVYVERRKMEMGCARCPEKHPACLTWHHLDGDQKEDSLCRLVDKNRPYDVLDAEMAKCVVLCENCHRKEHWDTSNRSKYRAIAGTRSIAPRSSIPQPAVTFTN